MARLSALLHAQRFAVLTLVQICFPILLASSVHFALFSFYFFKIIYSLIFILFGHRPSVEPF